MNNPNKWPVFTLAKNGCRVAINPRQATAVYEPENAPTEVYTLDCARAKDAWDVTESFEEVLAALEKGAEE